MTRSRILDGRTGSAAPALLARASPKSPARWTAYALSSLALFAGTALGQTATCTGTLPVCAINPDNYSESFGYTYTGTSAVEFANYGRFNVSEPASGSQGYYTVWWRNQGLNAGFNAGAGGPAADFTGSLGDDLGQIGGSVSTSPFTAYTQWFYANLYQTWGGNGGPASTSSDDGGAGAPGGVNQFANFYVPITVAGGAIGYGGSALEVHSIGGSGGDVGSTGVDGNGNPTYDGGKGGDGASGNDVNLQNAGPIQVGASGSPVLGSAGYRGLAALSMGGNGGTGSAGAQGGSGGPVTVTNSSPVNLYWQWSGVAPSDPFGANSPKPQPSGVWGILASSTSGTGLLSVTSGVNGGSSGSSGVVNVSVNQGGDLLVSSSGSSTATCLPLAGTGSIVSCGAGIGALSTGGPAGAGYDKSVGGTGGSVPSTSTTPAIAVGVTNAGITVSGDRIDGIVAQAAGGPGGSGGKGQDNSDGGTGGSVGYYTTQGVNVTLTNAAVSTAGASGAGIWAAVSGGKGGDGTNYENEASSGSTGQSCYSTSGHARSGCGGGGNTSAATVTLSGASSVSTAGAASPGIVAITQGGAGGAGGTLDNLATGTVGNGGSGGQGAPVTVTLNSGASVTTTGGIGAQPDAAAYGIFASSRGGAGGTGGEADTLLDSQSGNGGYGGGAYDVQVSVASGASVTTSGQNAAAIVAQSLSGSGGAGGEVFGGVVGNAGSGGTGGNTGNIWVVNDGTIRTSGDGAQGVLAQAMSGTGGAGGTGNGIFYSSGGTGGTAGTVNGVTFENAGTVATAGSAAHGILAQAIGGGGGDAGKSTGDVATLGGSGALAADGGFTVFNQTGGSVTTTGTAAIGVLAQAIGGGGGDGGNATGVIGTVGGSAGGGGAGGVALAQVTGGTLATSGAQAHGLVLQSIGGGGGNAGNATSASSLVAVTIGGSGGSGGAGNTVEALFSGGMTLQGTGAVGLAAQSIGGGGGSGGSGYAVSGGLVVDEALAVGGRGAEAAPAVRSTRRSRAVRSRAVSTFRRPRPRTSCRWMPTASSCSPSAAGAAWAARRAPMRWRSAYRCRASSTITAWRSPSRSAAKAGPAAPAARPRWGWQTGRRSPRRGRVRTA